MEAAEIELHDKDSTFDWLDWSTKKADLLLEKTRPLSLQVVEENPYKIARRKDTTEYLKLLIGVDNKMDELEGMNEVNFLESAQEDIFKLKWAVRKVRQVYGKLRIRDKRYLYR